MNKLAQFRFNDEEEEKKNKLPQTYISKI